MGRRFSLITADNKKSKPVISHGHTLTYTDIEKDVGFWMLVVAKYGSCCRRVGC